MADFYRAELSMLMHQIADCNSALLTAKNKRQRRLIESDIAVILAEIEDCYTDYLCEVYTSAL